MIFWLLNCLVARLVLGMSISIIESFKSTLVERRRLFVPGTNWEGSHDVLSVLQGRNPEIRKTICASSWVMSFSVGFCLICTPFRNTDVPIAYKHLTKSYEEISVRISDPISNGNIFTKSSHVHPVLKLALTRYQSN